MPLLIPPHRFAYVQEDIVRGGFPKPRNFKFIEGLNLKTVISLIPEPHDEVFCSFCSQNGIEIVHIEVPKPKDNLPLTSSTVLQCLSIMIQPDKLPLYIHCLDGTVITGIVVVCLRKLQTWILPVATLEYLRFLRDGIIGSEEQEFIEGFSPEFSLPYPSLPRWMWNNGKINFTKHPSFRLKSINPNLIPEALTSSLMQQDSSVSHKNNQSAMIKKMELDDSLDVISRDNGQIEPGEDDDDIESRVLQALNLEIPR